MIEPASKKVVVPPPSSPSVTVPVPRGPGVIDSGLLVADKKHEHREETTLDKSVTV